MNWRQWFAPGRGASLLIGLAACVYFIGRGIADEAPMGGVGGRAVMTENGKPIEGAMVVFRPVGAGEAEIRERTPFGPPTPPRIGDYGEVHDRVVETDEDGAFDIEHLKAGDYIVEASAQAHRMAPTRITVPEGRKYVVELQMKPIEPYLDVVASQKVFTPTEKPSFELHGFAPRMGLDVSLYKLDFAKVLAKGGLRDALGPLAERWESTPADPATLGSKVQSFSRDIQNRDAEGVFIEGVGLNPLPEGVYWVKCQVGGNTKGTYLNITKVALVTKSVGRDVTCFVTDIVSGKPVVGARVGYGSKGGFVPSGTTSAEGIAAIRVPNDGHAAVMAESGESKALADFYVESGEAEDARIFVYTDRPIYRPGDTVMFKGIIRKLAGPEYGLPQAGKVSVEVRDPEDSLLETMSLPTNAIGTYHGDFSLSKETAPGNYQVITHFGDVTETKYVSVAAYRKPEFSVTITPAEPYYIRGQEAKATIKCEYYFGGPVVGAEVRVNVDRQPLYSFGGENEDEAVADDEAPPDQSGRYGGGEGFDQIEAVTDEKGEAAIAFDTMLPDDPKEAEQDFIYNLNASVKDASGKYFEGAGSVKVVRGDVDLAVQVDDFIVEKDRPVKATIRAKSQKDGSPMGGLRVAVTSEFEVWTGRESAMLASKTENVTIGRDGTAQISLTPTRSGELRLTAKAHDVVARDWVYVEGGPVEDLGPKPPKLALKLDKRRYAIGDRATVMITTDSPGGWVLLSVEGEKLYSTQIVELKEKVTTARLTVAKDFAPNAFVAAAYVRNKKFSEASKRLVVDLGVRRLDVSVQSDKDVYHPGDTARYTIRTAAGGKPASAEVSLGVVDEAVYAIKEDDTKIVEGFFPKRQNRVSTSYSFPDLYLDGGDKGPSTVKVRTDFRDTAYWNPTVTTDVNGLATVDVKLPDNLTRWRATAVAVTKSTQVGSATQKIRARKELMVRLEAPAFMVQQDSQRLIALVSNETGRDADIHVALTVEGAGVRGDRRQTVHVRNGSQASVAWDVDASSSGEATFTAKAWIDSGASDGMRLVAPVKPHGRSIQDRQAGDLAGKTTLNMTVYAGADPNSGRLRITLTPTIASALLQSLDDLIGFPYGCVEQTMSRFMPTVVVAQAMRKLNLPQPARAKEIPAIVRDGFARLAKMQHADGGWGWWENDDSDMHMTAYVLEGYYLAQQAGYKPNPFSVERALKWAKARAKDAARQERREVMYLAYALALHGSREAAADALAALKYDPKRGTAIESASALMTYARLGAAYKSQAAACLKRLLALAKGSGGVRYWEEGYWGVETSARCLQAVASVDPGNPILAQAARYLMLSRHGEMWDSTRDTAYAILGLIHVMRALPPPRPGTVVSVKINGQVAARFTLTPEALTKPGMTVDIPVKRLVAGDNKIELLEQAPPLNAVLTDASWKPGVLYYSTELTQTVVRSQLGEVLNGGGMKIHRAYYKMESRRQDDGTLQLVPSRRPVTDVQNGDIVKCVLTIESAAPRDFLMVEDPIPAGCHVTEREALGEDEEWSNWYCDISIRDDRVVFFARNMPPGSNSISYMMRAETPGVSHALPASAFNMYDPATQAFSGEARLEVHE